jgi:hypothetical protein
MTGANETGHQRANAVTRENGSGKETSAKNSTAFPFAVYCVKHDGSRYLFQRYPTCDRAEAVAKTLCRVGCQATAEVAS